jgi:dUTP pyrophosphatase
MALLVKTLHPAAKIPRRESQGAAGYDLSSAVDVTIPPGGRAVVATGIAIAVPEGTYGRVAPRSGLAAKHGIDVLAGVIDEDYRGEVSVILLNTGSAAFSIAAGDRIAQLVLEKNATPLVAVVTDLESTARGGGGFGSTGVF